MVASISIREPLDDDWPTILELANRSVASVPGAGSQEAWLGNRRAFRGARRHFVAVEAGRDEVVGYAGIESVSAGEFRLFVVTPPERLCDVGEALYARAVTQLSELGARRLSFTEYAADQRLGAFARARGFVEEDRFRLPEGVDLVRLVKKLDAARQRG